MDIKSNTLELGKTKNADCQRNGIALGLQAKGKCNHDLSHLGPSV
jgi:hypothetical protein